MLFAIARPGLLAMRLVATVCSYDASGAYVCENPQAGFETRSQQWGNIIIEEHRDLRTGNVYTHHCIQSGPFTTCN